MKSLKTLALTLVLSLPLFFSCNSEDEKSISIACASNLRYAAEEICKDFQSESGVHCNLSFSSSGKLFHQIEQGAPFDIFLSANVDFSQKLANQGKSYDLPKHFASGSLVLWSADSIEAPIDSSLFSGFKRIALPNAQVAPYGLAAMHYLAKSGLHLYSQEKLVYAENIGQCNQYILSSAVDAGFTSLSTVMYDSLKTKGSWIAIESDMHPPIEQTAIIVKKEEIASPECNAFMSFLNSESARKTLEKFGYLLPSNE